MPKPIEYYERLLTDYLNNSCTPGQVEELLYFFQQDLSNKPLLKNLRDEFYKAMEEKAEVPARISDNLRKRLLEAIRPARVIPFYKRSSFRVAAACIIILLGAAWFFTRSITNDNPRQPAKQLATADTTHIKGATITLADGRIIALDNANSESALNQGSDHVIKLSAGKIMYDTAALNSTAVSYHTLTVPAGIRMIQLQLADGTTVWLNTASSLKYPTAFTGNDRSVELTGEAYFEVAHDATRPFKVNAKNTTVHVLGTGFNVSAYDDDQQTNVVLVHGSVAMTVTGHGNSRKLLTPGQLGSVEAGSGHVSVANVDTDEYTSWRKGYLILKQTPLTRIIKLLNRYYGVRIDGNVLEANHETFSGRLDLQRNIEEVMQLVCMGTSFIYIPEEKKISLKR